MTEATQTIEVTKAEAAHLLHLVRRNERGGGEDNDKAYWHRSFVLRCKLDAVLLDERGVMP